MRARPLLAGLGIAVGVEIQPSGAVNGNANEKHDPGGDVAGDDRRDGRKRGSDHQGQPDAVERTEHVTEVTEEHRIRGRVRCT